MAEDLEYPFNEIILDTTDWFPGMHRIIIQSIDGTGIRSHPVAVTIEVTNGIDVGLSRMLADEICDGVTVTPVENGSFGRPAYFGSQGAAALFNQGITSGLEMNEGIILSTGFATSWDNGNIPENTSGDLRTNGDEWLSGWLGGDNPEYVTYDAASLEFEVFSANQQLEIEMQFGSEKYDEYVGQYNDGFLVAVDGAVVSLTPDCDDVISVNAINAAPGFIQRSHLFTRTPRIEDNNRRVEYDGTTVLLRSHVLVKPSARHRIRFAIADARDSIYDSGLFVRKGSVRSINPQP